MHDIEASNMLLPVYDNTCSSHVTPTSDHDDVACVELDEIDDFALLEVKLDGIVDLNERVGVTNGSPVVGDNVGDTFATDSNSADLEEFVGGFLRGDAVDGKAAFHVIEEPEVFPRFLDRNDIHVAGGVGLIGANLVIDFDEALLDDRSDFLSSQRILQPVSEENCEGEGFAELVGARRWARSICSTKLIQHP